MFVLTCEAWPTFANSRLHITFISVSLARAALGKIDAAVVKKKRYHHIAKDSFLARAGDNFMCRDIANDLVLSGNVRCAAHCASACQIHESLSTKTQIKLFTTICTQPPSHAASHNKSGKDWCSDLIYIKSDQD